MPSTSQTFGRYEVLDTIGKGAMGIVYRCKDPQIGRIVAIKTLQIGGSYTGTPEELRGRMMKEAQAAGVLSHPNIVTIFDVGEEIDTVYIVMEFLEGNPLDEAVEGNRALHPRDVLRIVEQVGGALDYAHSKSIIHRDVKPANMMRTADDRAVLMDFGIAWVLGPASSEKGSLIGSPIYMSPEQIDGRELSGQADIYSLATVVYELLTGHRPFTGESFNDIVQAKYENKRIPLNQLNPSLPSALEGFFDQALAADLKTRFATCGDLLKNLRSAVFSAPGSATFLTSSQSPWTSTQGNAFFKEQAPPKPTPAPQGYASSDPHMAETLNLMMRSQMQAGTKPAEKQEKEKEKIQGQQTQPLPPYGVNTEQLNTPYTTQPLPAQPGGQKAGEFKINLPNLDEMEEKKISKPPPPPEKVEEASEMVSRQNERITFQSPEDLTVDGRKKLVARIKQAFKELDRIGENLAGLLDVGILYVRLGKFSEAMAYFKRAVKIDWECIDAYVNTAHIYTEFKMKEKAEDYWAISEWLSERQTGRFKVENCYRLGKKLETLNLIKGAITIWEEAGALQPWHLDTWRDLSRYYLQMKDYRKASSALQHITELSKFDALAWRNLAVCYQNTKDYYKALNAWEKALRLESSGEGARKAQKQIDNLKQFLKRQ